MPAYYSDSLASFVAEDSERIAARLHERYLRDGFSTMYTALSKTWAESVPQLQRLLLQVGGDPVASQWRVLLEYPLYRLRRRIDAVILAGDLAVVLEIKEDSTRTSAADRRQVEEYALDLRDFHEPSRHLAIIPVLWSMNTSNVKSQLGAVDTGVQDVIQVGGEGIVSLVRELAAHPRAKGNPPKGWDLGAYSPVPSVIEAATAIFAGHGVQEISRADAANLDQTARRVVEILQEIKAKEEKALIFVTGVPGSGKTLAGLEVVHHAVDGEIGRRGEIVYLSGNTPLVTVIREALARDEYQRRRARKERVTREDTKRAAKTRVQHIMDFLREYLVDGSSAPPHENAIVFDEAQRAWDADYGRRKFQRTASEPQLLLEILGRHQDWCAIVGLVGGGQEINTGENGMREWGRAVRELPEGHRGWVVYGPPGLVEGDVTTAGLGVGQLPSECEVRIDERLQLQVPMRSFRSPLVSSWVEAVIDGNSGRASGLVREIGEFPLKLTRSLADAKSWLRETSRGKRRFGLVASSGARRLRAEGLGVTLNATDRDKIAYWYLNESDDVRSSTVLEVTANEYTTQGLELDYVGVCWGGDLTWEGGGWQSKRFQGTKWVAAAGESRRFLLNSYRVLMTRSREGLVVWVPEGSVRDKTRPREWFDRTAEYLEDCGLSRL